MSMQRPDATGLRQSGKALEDSFFVRENSRLLKKLKEKEAEEAKRAAYREAGIENEALIVALIDLEISASAIAALSIVPLVEVAWADGEIQAKEREAIIKAAEEGGIEKDSPNHDLLENWLNEKPAPELLETWKTYARALEDRLDSVVGAELKKRLMVRTTNIAKAAGGFLGIGAISEAEKRMLNELESAFG